MKPVDAALGNTTLLGFVCSEKLDFLKSCNVRISRRPRDETYDLIAILLFRLNENTTCFLTGFYIDVIHVLRKFDLKGPTHGHTISL